MEQGKVSEKKSYERRLLLFGLACLISATIFFLPDLLTTENSLLEILGTVTYSDLVIEEVSSRNRIGFESTSRRASLVFFLSEQSKTFRLSENIGKDYAHPEYERLLKELKESRQVKIWIKSSERQSPEPKIFRIDIDNKTELDFEAIKYKNTGIFILLIFLGLGSVMVVLHKKYNEKVKGIFRN